MLSKSKPVVLIFLIPVLAIFLLLSVSRSAYAQATKDPWTTPLNLSQSGSTNNPVAVRDSNGVLHVIWQDKYAGVQEGQSGYVYTRFGGGNWSPPVIETFPFEDLPPILLPDSRGSIHAFWITNDESIAYTRMTATNEGLTWGAAQYIAESALAFQVVIDFNDVIHLAYIRPKEAGGIPAGVYYRQSRDGGGSWTPGELLYPSLYFRGMDKKDAHVSIASVADSEGTHVYVVWDNPARKQVLFSKSLDRGESWSDPVEIPVTDTPIGNTNPYEISVGAFDNNVVLIWQSGDPKMGCHQIYQSSVDHGESWTAPEEMPTNTYGCAGDNQVLSDNGLIYLMTKIQDGIYLLAYDGSQWSNPEFQKTITGFIDPETREMILFSCQSPILLPGGEMFVVGCDEGTGGDIWATSRSVSDTNSWFPPPSIWENQSQILESSTPISSPEIIADSRGAFHVIWVQDESSGGNVTPDNSRSVIYYSGFDGSDWSRPVKILSSPAGDADQPSIAIDGKDRLMVVWREKQSGSIYFSWANSARASSHTEWANPISLPTIQPLASSPNIAVNTSGEIYVVYSLPINEDRGIYLTTSADAGQNWSNPERVVDGIASGWEMVDQPQVTITGDSQLHVIWKVSDIFVEYSPLAIYYASSADEGLSWSEATALVESPAYWSEIASNGDKTIHLAWQDDVAQEYSLNQQGSMDGGQTWSRASKVQDLGTSIAPASLSEGIGSQQAFLLLVSQEPVDRQVLKQWIWNGEKWFEDVSLDLSSNPSVRINALNSAISTLGRLGVIYSQEAPGNVSEGHDYQLIFTDRRFTLEIESTTAVLSNGTQGKATVIPTEASLAAPTPTHTTLTATPAPVSPTQTAAGGRSRGEIILGVVMIIAVLGMVVGLAFMMINKREKP
jgi:hypothetical protein